MKVKSILAGLSLILLVGTSSAGCNPIGTMFARNYVPQQGDELKWMTESSCFEGILEKYPASVPKSMASDSRYKYTTWVIHNWSGDRFVLASGPTISSVDSTPDVIHGVIWRYAEKERVAAEEAKRKAEREEAALREQEEAKIAEEVRLVDFNRQVAAIRASKKVTPKFRLTQTPVNLFPGFTSDSLAVQLHMMAGKSPIVMAPTITMISDDPIVLEGVKINHKPSVPGCGADIFERTDLFIMPMGGSFTINPTKCEGKIILIELLTSSGVISIRN